MANEVGSQGTFRSSNGFEVPTATNHPHPVVNDMALAALKGIQEAQAGRGFKSDRGFVIGQASENASPWVDDLHAAQTEARSPKIGQVTGTHVASTSVDLPTKEKGTEQERFAALIKTADAKPFVSEHQSHVAAISQDRGTSVGRA